LGRDDERERSGCRQQPPQNRDTRSKRSHAMRQPTRPTLIVYRLGRVLCLQRSALFASRALNDRRADGIGAGAATGTPRLIQRDASGCTRTMK
jgi:hypothetical protein